MFGNTYLIHIYLAYLKVWLIDNNLRDDYVGDNALPVVGVASRIVQHSRQGLKTTSGVKMHGGPVSRLWTTRASMRQSMLTRRTLTKHLSKPVHALSWNFLMLDRRAI
jgi:hypothetical protein